jgi:hypothetical protein
MTALRLKKAWKIWPVGHVIPDAPGNLARSLISRGMAEEAVDKKPESRLSKVLAIPNRMVASAPVKKR